MGRRQYGAVRKLPSGRWQARYLGPDGRYRNGARTFATKADANRYLSQVQADRERGVWLDPEASSTRLRDYALRWLEQRTVKGQPLAARTRDTYRHSLDAWILPTLGDLPLSRIGPADVRTWHAAVAARTGPTATRQAYALLRAILNTAVADEALHRNPCRIHGAGQPNSPERPLLDLEQVEALVRAVPEHLRTLVITAFWAHARMGEVLGLRVGDVDLAAGTLRIERQLVEVDQVGPVITTPKAGSRRTVHLPTPAVVALAEHLAAKGPALASAPLFVRPDGRPLRAHHVNAAWETARNRAGVPGAHFHDLRHAGLTLTAQTGATLAEVMRRAGHSSTAAALRYQHAAEQRDAEIASNLSRVAQARRLNPTPPTAKLDPRAETQLNQKLSRRAATNPLGSTRDFVRLGRRTPPVVGRRQSSGAPRAEVIDRPCPLPR